MDKNQSTWFISDARISNVGEDAFSHVDYARELKAKMIELPTPLTIALSGEHGTGKSSIGALLEQELEKDTRFRFVRIEAWRHEGETRRKAFLYDVLESLSQQFAGDDRRHTDLEALKRKLYASESRQTAVLDLTAARDSVRVLWDVASSRSLKAAALVALIVVVILVAGYFATVHVATAIARNALLASIPGTLSLPFAAGATAYFAKLVNEISQKVLDPAKITVTTNPPSGAEQYEQIFRNALQIALANGDKAKTMVLLVDELDRLPPDEIIEALRAIRTFRDVKPCVFVVGLDEDVVKRAVLDSRTGAGLVEGADEAEEFLNKFFKLRQHVPLLVSRDMREFARGLVSDGPRRRINAGIGALTAPDLDDVLDALIHRRVKTPRHVIRLINAFNSDYRLASVREQAAAGLLSKEAITGKLPFLALINVLREDYPDFFAAMLLNQDLIFALDMFLDGRSITEVEAAFPTYMDACAPFFETSPVDGTDDRTTDFGRERPQYRDLFLHLRNTAKFRAPSVSPFIYLREDQAARLLGSATKEQMAEEFESNATASLRSRIADGGESYARAAAQVSFFCLDEAKGIRLENSILASCDLFDQFDEASRPSLANQIAQKVFQNRSIVSRVNPKAFLEVLTRASPSHYVTGAVGAMAGRLNAEDTESVRDVLRALVVHSDLVTDGETLKVISDYTAAMAKSLPIADLSKEISALLDSQPTERVLSAFYGSDFLRGCAELASSIAPEEIPADLDKRVLELFTAMESAAEGWEESYLETAILLLNSRTWNMYNIGFDIASRHLHEMNPVLTQKTLEKLYDSENFPGTDDTTESHEALRALTVRIAEQFGAAAFAAEPIKDGLNAYLEASLDAKAPEVRTAVPDFLHRLVPILPAGYFESFADVAIAYIPLKIPGQEASDALAAVTALASQLQDEKLQSLYNAMTLLLRSAAATPAAAFGANVMVVALERAPTPAIRNAAVSYLPSLVGLVVLPYTPANLVYIAQVLDAAALQLGPSTDTYLTNIDSYMKAAAAQNMAFGIARLEPLARNGLGSPAGQATVAQTIVNLWPNLPSSETKHSAAQLLELWADRIPQGSLSAFWSQQVGIMDTSPQVAWSNLIRFWQQMPTDMRAQALTAGLRRADMVSAVLDGISSSDHALAPEQIQELLSQLHDELDGETIRRLSVALSLPLSLEDRDKTSALMFSQFSGQPETLNRDALLAAASALATTVSPEGVDYFVSLLQGGQDAREYALRHMPAWLDGKPQLSVAPQELIAAMASAVETDSNDLVAHNLNAAMSYGFHREATYRDALQRKKTHLTGSKDNGEKTLLKKVRAALRR